MSLLLDKAITKFGKVTDSPKNILGISEVLENDIKHNLKELYDFTKNEENKTKSRNSLPILHIKNLDLEQIWQQLDLKNSEIIDTCINNIGSLTLNKEKLFFKNFETQQDDLDESDLNRKDCEDESPSEESNDDKESGDDESEEEMTDFKVGKKKSVVDDDFFKLEEMEAFLNKEEKETSKSKADRDSTDESDDENEDNESVDMFNANESEEDSDEENEAKTAKFKDYFVDKGNNEKKRKRNKLLEDLEDSDNESDEVDGTAEELISTLEQRQERLKRKIEEIEDDAIKEKPWMLKGEVTSQNRPQNSLLEEVVEFDLTSRPAPVITEQTSLQLEDIIRQRIKDKAFDSVERKSIAVETPLEYKKKLVLDQEKSKQSLAQIYENQYLEQQAAKDDQEKEEEEPELHKEIKTLMSALFRKLDALSNFHFTSKAATPELKIVSNLPAINMEEVAPVAASDATLLAPEEIKGKPKGELIGKQEQTATDRKRARRKKKLKQKIHSKLKEKKDAQKKEKISKKFRLGPDKK